MPHGSDRSPADARSLAHRRRPTLGGARPRTWVSRKVRRSSARLALPTAPATRRSGGRATSPPASVAKPKTAKSSSMAASPRLWRNKPHYRRYRSPGAEGGRSLCPSSMFLKTVGPDRRLMAGTRRKCAQGDVEQPSRHIIRELACPGGATLTMLCSSTLRSSTGRNESAAIGARSHAAAARTKIHSLIVIAR